jgi:aspartate/methionine/tyrosine aminotransferase
MNPIAEKLNATLEGTVAGRLLSKTGRHLFFPKGIVAQSAEAKSRAHRFNATAGMAYAGGVPMILPAARELTTQFSPAESVAYAPTSGVAALRDRWKQEMIAKNPGLEGVKTSTPLVTAGLTNGIVHIAELFVDPGDPVIMPDMFWGNYRLILEHRKEARIVTFPFFTQEGNLNTDGFAATCREAAKDRGKLIILLNFPNNPTGYTPTQREADSLVATLTSLAEEGTDILVVTDDAYFGLFFEPGLLTESVFTPLATAHERILAAKVDGATKEDFAWGLRVGFLTFASPSLENAALDALEQKAIGSLRAVVSNTSNLSQQLLLKVMEHPDYARQKEEARAVLEGRYRTLTGRLEEKQKSNPGSPLAPLPFNSGYFMSFDCGPVDAEALRQKLLERGIGTISIGSRYLRVAFASVDEEAIGELVDEIYDAAAELRNT